MEKTPDKEIKNMEKITKDICSCPKKARAFFIKAGICDKEGNIIKKGGLG